MRTSSSWLTTASRRRRLPVVLAAVSSTLLLCLASPAGAGAADGGSPMSVSALPSAEVERALSAIPLEGLSAPQLSELLAARLSGSPTVGLKQALTKAIEGLAERDGTIGQLKDSSALVSELESKLGGLPLGELLGLLKGHLSIASMLGEDLGSLSARQLVGELLKSAGESGQPLAPAQLLEQLLAAPGSETLQGLLGTSLTGTPVSVGTVEELAGQADTTSQGLAEDFDTTSAQLPAGAMALTAPLTDGKLLGVLKAVEGVDVGTLTPELPLGSGGSGGSGSSGGAGGSGSSGGSGGGVGGSGGSGGSATPGSTTIVEELSMPAENAPGKGVVPASGKVRIISKRVKGDTLTVLAQVPAAGRLRLLGRWLKSTSTQVDAVERVSIRAVLTKAGAASLRAHAHRLRVRVELSFKPVDGPGSSVTASVVFD
jgi:uncharacterized membrane protein YgcG